MPKNKMHYPFVTDAIKAQRYLEIVERLTKLGLWNKVFSGLEKNGIDRILIDTRLANKIKDVIKDIPDSIKDELDNDTVKCGSPSPGNGGDDGDGRNVGNVRGLIGKAANTDDKDSFEGISKAEIVLLVEDYYKGNFRITEQSRYFFTGKNNFFDVFIPFSQGRLSLSEEQLINDTNRIVQRNTFETYVISGLYNPSMIFGFGDFYRWYIDNSVRNQNRGFSVDFAKKILRRETPGIIPVAGVVGRLLGSEYREDSKYTVANQPITVRRLSNSVKLPLYFIGSNLNSKKKCTITISVLSKRPVNIINDFSGNEQLIFKGITATNNIEWWLSKYNIDVQYSEVESVIEFSFDNVVPYD